MENMIESYKSIEMTPDERIQAVSNLKRNLEDNFVQLGQLLLDMRRTKLFKFKGYKNFRDFVEAEFNFSSSFANKIIGNFEFFVKELDIDEQSVKNIGLDKLNMLKPMVKKMSFEETDHWLKKAVDLPSTELREEIKEIREKQKTKEKTLKDIFSEQYLEKMVTFFNCNRKELDFKLALYFQDLNLDEVQKMIKINERQFQITDEK
ncbi:MAG: hypothetical protein HN692_02725 [Candidatus Cloacimonetes bacterium]|jgi:hypothetical protein|nr:hypothetical protein [Candidatus Cloacimonadota bacterium]